MPAISHAILLAGVSGDTSRSMRRYARELSLALSGPGLGWAVSTIEPQQRRWLSRLWGHPQAARIESAFARYAIYPINVASRTADLFHVLDHAYGHLVRVLDASRTIVTCHDLIPLRCADGRLPIAMPPHVVRTVRLRLRAMMRAARILTDSEATRDDLLHYCGAASSTITVVSPGVNPIFTPADGGEAKSLRASLAIGSDAPVILQVATKGRYKNTPVLLRALALVRARVGSPVVLVRVGAPLHHDEMALANSLGVSTAIRSPGAVDDETLAQWYRAATVLAFPSLWEGFGWPPLEAMASGTPVVASRVAAVEEVVGDAGALIDPLDDRDLAAALTRVITEPGYAAALRGRGLERARQFTWDRAARRTIAVYNEVSGR